MRKLPFLPIKVLKFAIVGGIGMIVDFSLTITMKEYFAFNTYVANLIGVSIAILVIFFLHKKWTFANRNRNVYKQFHQFILVSVLGCVWNLALLLLFQEYFIFPFYLAKSLAIILVGVWNFSINSIITFKSGARLTKFN